MNILRRLPLSRLLLLCGVLLAVGIGATALAIALGVGPTPPPKPLADAVHDALAAAAGIDRRRERTASSSPTTYSKARTSRAAGGEAPAPSSPLVSGASGRLWIAEEGHVRLELQSEKGDTQIFYDGHTLSMYDASSNTLYRYTPPRQARRRLPGIERRRGRSTPAAGRPRKKSPAWRRSKKRSPTSSSTPTSPARPPRRGRPGRIHGARVAQGKRRPAGGAELSWDADHGVPLRAAVYSTESSSPVLELAATSISYGPVEPSVFEFTPPANAKVEKSCCPSTANRAAPRPSANTNTPT